MDLIKKVYWTQDMFQFFHKVEELTQDIEYYHAHEGMEFVYVHEGSGKLIINERLYPIEPRTLLFSQPYQLHFNHVEPPYQRTVFNFKPSILEPFSKLFPTLYTFMSHIANSPLEIQVFRLTEEQEQQLNDRFYHFGELIRTVPVHEQKEAVLLFTMNFLSYLMTRVFPTENISHQPIRPQKSRHVEKMLQWIEMHFKEPFELSKMAEELFLSPNYISGLFHKVTGKKIIEYITTRRMQEACLLLHSPSASIHEVAKQSGFDDPSYFTRIFKQRYGQTPRQYRRHLTTMYPAQRG
ncbi:AraC family transcriptional regulator [Paenibacillus sp. RC67]|uniref:AraC family transcriptional regulator n=1 Tax=Paenibacillus sp. RC67 TaxID=3039392 RepID=UPI0024AD9EC6|nr:AraC family transcriptional regulator [Paenibacillus sp. RC67]